MSVIPLSAGVGPPRLCGRRGRVSQSSIGLGSRHFSRHVGRKVFQLSAWVAFVLVVVGVGVRSASLQSVCAVIARSCGSSSSYAGVIVDVVVYSYQSLVRRCNRPFRAGPRQFVQFMPVCLLSWWSSGPVSCQHVQVPLWSIVSVRQQPVWAFNTVVVSVSQLSAYAALVLVVVVSRRRSVSHTAILPGVRHCSLV